MKNQLVQFDPQPTNQEELEEILKIIWENIPQEYINNLIETFENRLEMCLQVYGESISHFLSAGRKSAKETDLFDKDYIPHLLTKEEIEFIYNLNLKMKHRWTRISKFIENEISIDPISIKYFVIPIERKIIDYKLHPEKYEECPEEIRDFIQEDDESEFLPENDDDEDEEIEEEYEYEYEYEYEEEYEEEESN